MKTKEQGTVVTADDWENAGYRDGIHGNGKSPPRAGLSGGQHGESVAAYLHGFGRGEAEAAVARLSRRRRS